MDETKQRFVAEFDKNSMEMIKVHLVEWKAQTYVDARIWFKADDGVYHPSTKGIRLNAELLPDLITALEKAQEELEDGPGVEIVSDQGGQGAGESR